MPANLTPQYHKAEQEFRRAQTPEDELRALDDRSLNGLFVNGEQVEWAPLSDGDELEIGRYRLYVLEA